MRGARARRAEALLPGVDWLDDPHAAADGASALVFLTEWNQFRALDLCRLAAAMDVPRMIDLRTIDSDEAAKAAGFAVYAAVGRTGIEAHDIPAEARRAS